MLQHMQVLKAIGSGARGHTDPTLIEDFGRCIEMVSANVFLLLTDEDLSTNCHPFGFAKRKEDICFLSSAFFFAYVPEFQRTASPCGVQACVQLHTRDLLPNTAESFDGNHRVSKRFVAQTREVFVSKTAQPFIISGSGVLGWDTVACNLVGHGEKALVVGTGHFSDRFEECLVQFGVNVTKVDAPTPGARASNEQIEKTLKDAKANGKPFQVITITGVDTSTAVLADLQNICNIVKAVSPDTLIVVDAVCSAAGEELRMDEWGIDFVLTGSQKAFGVPPGLCIMIASQKAMARMPSKEKVRNYFANLPRWLPIMNAYEARTPSYFGTPAVNTIGALRVGLEQMLSTPDGMQGYWKVHRDARAKVHAAVKDMGCELLTASPDIAANLLTCIRYPKGKGVANVLPAMKEAGWFLAAGLHPKCKDEYFRVGHMGYAVAKTDMLDRLLNDLKRIVKS